MAQQQPSPEILCPRAVAPPEEHHDAGAADFFAGAQQQVRALQARLDPERPLGLAREAGGPGARPAQADDDASVARLQIEERQRLDRGSSAPVAAAASMGMQLQLIAGRECVGQGCKIGVCRLAPLRMVNDQCGSGLVGKRCVEGLEALQDRRVPGPGVPEINHPVHRRIVVVLDRHATNLQAGERIGMGHGPLRCLSGPLVDRLGCSPRREQLRGRAAIVAERKRPRRGIRAEARPDPTPRRFHLSGRGTDRRRLPREDADHHNPDNEGQDARTHRLHGVLRSWVALTILRNCLLQWKTRSGNSSVLPGFAIAPSPCPTESDRLPVRDWPVPTPGQ